VSSFLTAHKQCDENDQLQSVEQDRIVAGNIFAMLDNANTGVNRIKFITLATGE